MSDSDRAPIERTADDDLGGLLLRHADLSFAPPPSAESTVWNSVQSALVGASVAPAPLASSVASVATNLSATQRLSLALSWKVGLGVVVLGLLGGAGAYATSSVGSPASSLSADSPATLPLAVPVEGVTPAVAQSVPAIVAASDAPTTQATAASRGPAAPSISASSLSHAASSAATQVVATATSEAERLLEARHAIRAGDGARALTLLAAVSGTGAYAEEREVLTIEALLPSNREKAHRLATQFVQQRPKSPYRARAEAALHR